MNNHRKEIEHIKKDINALKANGSALVKDVRHDGGGIIREGFQQLRRSGNNGLHRIEDRIKDKPGQTLALGIISGLILSYFLNHRK
ncbi:MAG: hypothetical protein ACXW30_05010 [Micavibrio sp.]